MGYTKTAWVDGAAPAINAANLNKIEQGVADAHAHIPRTDNPHGVTSEQINALAENAKAATDLLTTYPKGITIFRTTTAGKGFPTQWGTVTTFRGVDYGYQYFAQAGAANTIHFRVYDLASNTWDAWAVFETTAGAQSKANTAEANAKNASAPIGHVGAGGNAHAAAVANGANGFMTGADKDKLDKIAANANNYVHPTTSGNKHIPSGGAANQFLEWQADGTAVWSLIDAAQITEDANNRFVSDSQIGQWDAKETPEGAQSKIDNSLTPSWSNLQLASGVTAVTGREPRFTLLGSEVIIEGELASGLAQGTKIATLNSGFRPLATRFFKTAINTTISNDGATIYVDTAGNIMLYSTPTSSYSISLMGIRFFINL